jgi:hypothetical protein
MQADLRIPEECPAGRKTHGGNELLNYGKKLLINDKNYLKYGNHVDILILVADMGRR